MTSTNTTERLHEIEALINDDAARLEVGDDARLTLVNVSDLLTEATEIVAAAGSVRLTLTDAEQQQASTVLPLWERQIARMSKSDQMREVHQRRADSDRVALALLATLTTHAEVERLARQPLDDRRAQIFELRQAGARWRALQRQPAETRRQAAELRATLEGSRGTPPAPRPDRSTWALDYRGVLGL
jgi:hypothetical protein